MDYIPLHPGTHLNIIDELRQAELEWKSATDERRQFIIRNIYDEIALYGDIRYSSSDIFIDDIYQDV